MLSSVLVAVRAIVQELHFKGPRITAKHSLIRDNSKTQFLLDKLHLATNSPVDLSLNTNAVTARGTVVEETILGTFTMPALRQILSKCSSGMRDELVETLCIVSSRLSDHLQESGTQGYLSHRRSAKFYRKMANPYPELLGTPCAFFLL